MGSIASILPCVAHVNIGSAVATVRPLARALFNLLPIRPAHCFQVFFKRITLSNKSADRTCKSPTGVHFKARNDLADDVGRAGVDFA